MLILVAGVDNAIAGDTTGKLKLDENDRFLCFLPLAHILEYVYELCAIHWGGTIGYGNPRTLVQDSVRNCKGDILEFKPTILVAYVPTYTEIVFLLYGKRSAKRFLRQLRPRVLSFAVYFGQLTISRRS